MSTNGTNAKSIIPLDLEENQEKLRLLSSKLSRGEPKLSPDEIQEGLSLLTKISSTALQQSKITTEKLDEIQTHTQDHGATLEIVKSQIETIAVKVENSTRCLERIDSEVRQGFKQTQVEMSALKNEVQDMTQVVRSIADHLGVKV